MNKKHSLPVLSATVELPRTPPTLGTISICAQCPSSVNCCGRVKVSGSVDVPILFPWEVENIAASLRHDADDFSVAISGPLGRMRLMIADAGGCHFFENGKCRIYAVRPVDCRLFPLDIIEGTDGRLRFIVYSRICPSEYDPTKHLAMARELIAGLSEADIRSYARLRPSGMSAEPYVELEEGWTTTDG